MTMKFERTQRFSLLLFALVVWLCYSRAPVSDASRGITPVSSKQPQERLLSSSSSASWRINDQTLDLLPKLDHDKNSKRSLILTDIGWNNPDQSYALRWFTRSIRTRELLQAFVRHPDFDATFVWSDMMTNASQVEIDPQKEYVVFMDIETCFESHYPHYTGTFESNADKKFGRVVKSKDNPCQRLPLGTCRDLVSGILDSPLFQLAKKSTLFLMDCSGGGLHPQYRHDFETSTQVSVLSVGSVAGQLQDKSDMGLPHAAVYPIYLSDGEEQDIRSCESDKTTTNSRPHFFTWIGDGRIGSPRGGLFTLRKDARDGEDVVIMHDNEYKKDLLSTYKGHVRKSLFVATPRGMDHSPYRFTEALSAGAIPVVHSDGWVLPFRKKVVDWSKCAVIIPEAKVDKTLQILRSISQQQRCRMRQHCYFEIYQKYMANATANMEGILESLRAI